jgi:hypothetical protein
MILGDEGSDEWRGSSLPVSTRLNQDQAQRGTGSREMAARVSTRVSAHPNQDQALALPESVKVPRGVSARVSTHPWNTTVEHSKRGNPVLKSFILAFFKGYIMDIIESRNTLAHA